MAKKCNCKQEINKVFVSKLKPRCFTDKEYTQYNELNKKELTIENKFYIYNLYSKVFKVPLFIPSNNNDNPLIKMIEELNKLSDIKKNK